MITSPLYRDPIYDGAADPMIIRKESDGKYYMFYTQRRANQKVEGTTWCYGTAIGVAESDNGSDWHYRGDLDLDFEFGHNTFWAPEIVYDKETATYHMYVSYIQGVYRTWDGKKTIEQYSSKDLFYWDHIGTLEFDSNSIIDPCLYQLPDGRWRMWYKDESAKRGGIWYADSADLLEWKACEKQVFDRGEGPNVFSFGGKYWLIVDEWKGFAVFSSDDLEHFVRQEENILKEPGNRPGDRKKGAHADVFVSDDRAFIVYFTDPGGEDQPDHTNVHMAELKLVDGKLTCDRNAEIDVDWN